ncbi:hypothetical protein FB567DRAFT_544361 [Paraphoma chrysanthemicola]|uniref:Uncharacterized protein n=1 Tax=Paraphoma chrysanthemicola TaxID=798071 RepID=A0A8K0RDM8_9PLEO|nr:hypothetical protein FB567DRAFT_544361 [Paraphoma chrysanthemicola]
MPVTPRLRPISEGRFTLDEEVLWRNILQENTEYSYSKPETWPFFPFCDVAAGCEGPIRFDVLPRYVVYDQPTIWQLLTDFPRPTVGKEYHYRWPFNFRVNGTIKTGASMTDAEVRGFVEHLRQIQPMIPRGSMGPILPPLEPRPGLVPLVPRPIPDEHSLFSGTPMHDSPRPHRSNRNEHEQAQQGQQFEEAEEATRKIPTSKVLDTATILIKKELKFFGDSLHSLQNSPNSMAWLEEAEGWTDVELGAIEKAAMELEKLSADLRECIVRIRASMAKSKASSPN